MDCIYLGIYVHCSVQSSSPVIRRGYQKDSDQAGNVLPILRGKGFFIKLISLLLETAILPIAQGLSGEEKQFKWLLRSLGMLRFSVFIMRTSSRVTFPSLCLFFFQKKGDFSLWAAVMWAPLGFPSGSVSPQKRHSLLCPLPLPLSHTFGSKHIQRMMPFTRFEHLRLGAGGPFFVVSS